MFADRKKISLLRIGPVDKQKQHKKEKGKKGRIQCGRMIKES